MAQTWTPEKVVSPDLARKLISTQFPELLPITVSPFGDGWDNTAYLINDKFVFRFPRRTIAVDLLRTESTALPAIAPKLPIPVPAPGFVGKPTAEYEWIFSGYECLTGETADRKSLGDQQRWSIAESLALFLKRLHGLDQELARIHNVPDDLFGRLDLNKRKPQLLDNLRSLKEQGELQDTQFLLHHYDLALQSELAEKLSLVHGDLYPRHLLVDDEFKLSGIIDWGDMHLGHPAVDLKIAHTFFSAEARKRFRDIYGNVDPQDWQIAKGRAIVHSSYVLQYALDINDQPLINEARVMFSNLLEPDLTA